MKPLTYRICIVAWCLWALCIGGLALFVVSAGGIRELGRELGFVAGAAAFLAAPAFLLQYLLVGFWNPARLWRT